MSEMEKLAASMKLKRDGAEANAKAINTAREEKIGQWVESLNKLFDDIENWLEPLTQNGLAQFNRGLASITEKPTPTLEVTYKAPVLPMSINGLAARIQPKGLYNIGSDGVVEFLAREKQYLFTRHVGSDVEWVLRDKAGPKGNGVPLTQDSLAGAISHYLEGLK